jgi:hypothetical protein
MRVGASTICRSVAFLAVVLVMPQGAFAWGREGHQTIVIVAEHYMRPATAAQIRQFLAPETPEEASGWTATARHQSQVSSGAHGKA